MNWVCFWLHFCTSTTNLRKLMFQVQDILIHPSGPMFITMSSDVTDVFVCLLCYIIVNWRNLWPPIKSSGWCTIQLGQYHHFRTSVEHWEKSTHTLPVLTGHDTTSNKISTKLVSQKAVHNLKFSLLIINFDCLYIYTWQNVQYRWKGHCWSDI